MATLHILFVMIIRFHTLHSQSYILQKQGLNFEDADALCLFNFDRHLASIHTLKAWTDANSTRETYAVWIGLTLNAITNLWTYIDSTSFDYGGNPIGISPPWFTNEPNDYYGNENCVEMNAAMAGLWNDAQCSSLKYALCNSPKPIYILKDPLDYRRIPTFNHSIGYIDILDEVYVEFDVILHSYPESCATILHFGDTNISQSFPGICISGSHKFHLRFSLVSNSDPVHTTDAVNLSTLYHVTLYQTQKRLTITMNNLSVYDNETGSHPIMFHRTMYFGDPWHDAADATLSNLIVTTSNSHAPNSFNYICEGWNRWTNISGSWSVSNAANTCGMHQNDETYEGAVAWLGTLDPSSIAWTDYKIQVKFTINSADWGALLGRFTDKSGAKQALIVCQIASALSYFFLGSSTSLRLLFISRLTTIAQQVMQTAQASIAQLTDEVHREQSLGRLSMAYGIGMILGSTLSGIIAKYFSLKTNAFLAAFFSLSVALIDMLFLPPLKAAQNSKASKEKPKRGGILSNFGEIASLAARPIVTKLCLFLFFGGFGIHLYRSMFSLIFKEVFGFEGWQLGFFISFAALTSTLSNSFFVGWAKSKYNDKVIVQCCAVTLALCLAVFGYGCSKQFMGIAGLCILSVPQTIASGFLYVMISGYISKIVDSSEMGTAIALTHALRSFTGVIAPTIGGHLVKFGYQYIGYFGFWSGMFSVILFRLSLQ